MRDPARIDRIATKLAALWSKHPDMRLGQLIANLTRDRSGSVNGALIFNVEDDAIEARIVEVDELGFGGQ